MDAQPKRGLAVTLILFSFGLTAIISQLKDGFNSKPIGFITNCVQNHGYNRSITSLSEKPNCRVRIIYNLNSTDLKAIQDERKSKIKEVCDMCSRNRTPVDCNHVLEKHKVRDWSQYSPSTMTLTYKCQIYSMKGILNLNLYFKYVLMCTNIFPM